MRLALLTCLGVFLAGVVFAGQLTPGVIHPDDISAVWLFAEGEGDVLVDSEGPGLNGTIVGAEWVDTGRDKGLKFNGVDSVIRVPDSGRINTGGPFPERTVMALFKCDDVSITDRKQVIFDEGGRTRGAVLYVHGGMLWAGSWNKDANQSDWVGEWISTPIQSNQWYYGAYVWDAGAAIDGTFELWLNGRMMESAPASQLWAHGDDTGIGAVNQNSWFHDDDPDDSTDDDGSGTDIHHFAGIIDEVRVYTIALGADDMGVLSVSVEPAGKMATVWADLKQ